MTAAMAILIAWMHEREQRIYAAENARHDDDNDDRLDGEIEAVGCYYGD